jgi:hypothetical protein
MDGVLCGRPFYYYGRYPILQDTHWHWKYWHSMCTFLDLFYEILIATPTGKNLSECLQMVMLQMIHKNAPIRHWAPFTIVGSPMLRLFVPDNN